MTEAEFAPGNYGRNGSDADQQLFKNILDDLYNSGYNFMELDSGGWGTLDMLVVIHSGYSAEDGPPPEGCNEPQPENRVWSHGSSGSANGWFSPDYSFSVSNFLLASGFHEPVCGDEPVQLGVLAHEFMHGFALLDLYDLDDEEEAIPLGGTGRFGIMSNA